MSKLYFAHRFYGTKVAEFEQEGAQMVVLFRDGEHRVFYANEVWEDAGDDRTRHVLGELVAVAVTARKLGISSIDFEENARSAAAAAAIIHPEVGGNG